MPLSVIMQLSTCIMAPPIKHRPNKYWFAIALHLLEEQQLMYYGFLCKNCYSLSVCNETTKPQNNFIGSYLSKCGKIHLQVNSNTPRASEGICQQKELCPTTAAPPPSQDKGLLQEQKQEVYLQPPSLGWRMQVPTESFTSPPQKLLWQEIFNWAFNSLMATSITARLPGDLTLLDCLSEYSDMRQE